MGANSSKQHQVMSAENHQNKIDGEKLMMKRKLEGIIQTLLSTKGYVSNPKRHGFVNTCKIISSKIFDDEYLKTLNEFTMPGELFQFIL